MVPRTRPRALLAREHGQRLRLSGISDAEPIRARIEAREPGSGKLPGNRVVSSHDGYESGCPFEVHFGPGKAARVGVRATLPDGRAVDCRDVEADKYTEPGPADGGLSAVPVAG